MYIAVRRLEVEAKDHIMPMPKRKSKRKYDSILIKEMEMSFAKCSSKIFMLLRDTDMR